MQGGIQVIVLQRGFKIWIVCFNRLDDIVEFFHECTILRGHSKLGRDNGEGFEEDVFLVDMRPIVDDGGDFAFVQCMQQFGRSFIIDKICMQLVFLQEMPQVFFVLWCIDEANGRIVQCVELQGVQIDIRMCQIEGEHRIAGKSIAE